MSTELIIQHSGTLNLGFLFACLGNFGAFRKEGFSTEKKLCSCSLVVFCF